MGDPYGYNLPATAVCPGCQTMVVLPMEPLFDDTPAAICAECGTEVPDYRRADYSPTVDVPTGYVMQAPEEDETPIGEQRFTRRNLFRSLGGIVAEKGLVRIEEAKSRFTE